MEFVESNIKKNNSKIRHSMATSVTKMLKQFSAYQYPKTLADAIAYVRMDPPVDYASKVEWDTNREKLRGEYKKYALTVLHDLLKTISTRSLEETEDSIDAAMLRLQSLAPVDWTFDRRSTKDYGDGSRSYELIGVYAVINANGAFSFVDRKGEKWLEQPTATGTAFVKPEGARSRA
ncbi:hypothetical protein [Paraburkholderia sp. J67]|uniref:hypothetical protein n=1 Tax=Paraburkholderia sp. J67 TaxID=2805435 RepID=UPI002ABE86B9|nr:hypothetical protein [Paraburkholderia sp. J67]